MARPAPSTIQALRKLKESMSYRELAEYLGLDWSTIGTLNDLLKKGITVSLEIENNLRGRMGLRPVTESGYPVKKNKIDRPYASVSQQARKEALGFSWDIIIETGLEYLEEMKEGGEVRKRDGNLAQPLQLFIDS